MGLQAKNLMKEENMKKYELTTESKGYDGRKLFRIKALVSFGNVKKGGRVDRKRTEPISLR